jgi:hypothetical protein
MSPTVWRKLTQILQVVLADGSIVNANKRSNADLWRALKGGANNFGKPPNIFIAGVE